MVNKTPAEVFPPGEFIRDELEARGWTQQDLADILNRPLVAVNQIITGRRGITPDTAKALGDAFGTGPELWLNLESAYRLWKVAEPDPDVARRAKLYEYAPVNELLRRNWIAPSNSVAVLESQILRLFEVTSLEDTRKIVAAARKSTDPATASPAEAAWFSRVRQLARAVNVKPFSHSAFVKQLPTLRSVAGADPENIRHIPKILGNWGIRFVVVEPLQKTRVDGASLWLGDDKNSPVVAVSVRFDRIDGFWFTLIHELIHIKYKDKSVIDVDIVLDPKGDDGGGPQSEVESRTNREAEEFLIPQAEIGDFIDRIKPLFSKKQIIGFANRMAIHPGIVVGQLQYRKAIQFSHSREMLLQGEIRKQLVQTALVDGWGHTPGPL